MMDVDGLRSRTCVELLSGVVVDDVVDIGSQHVGTDKF